MRLIDFNCDLGESEIDKWEYQDKSILPWISSANVSCGVHAGTPFVIEKTLIEAKNLGVAVGAHPGLWDPVSMGRTGKLPSLSEIPAILRYQLGALKALAEPLGVFIAHVKPHGILYHELQKNIKLARIFVTIIKEFYPCTTGPGHGKFYR